MDQLKERGKMARYIDADLLLSTLNENKIPYDSDINYFICHAPTAAVVEVVRCKDCRYGNKLSYDKVWCSLGNDMYAYHENDFCSYAERREDGEIH